MIGVFLDFAETDSYISQSDSTWLIPMTSVAFKGV